MRCFVTFLAFLVSAHADILLLRGKVVMADGSVPPATVAIERICAGGKPQRQALTDRKGEFVWRALDDRITANQAIATDLGNSNGVSSWLEGAKSASNACILRASLTGYESNSFDLGQLGWTSNPDLPPLTLYRKGEAPVFDFSSVFVPPSAAPAWERAAHAIQAKNWTEAERQLHFVQQNAPKFSAVWSALALVAHERKDPAAEREACRHAIAANPKALAPMLELLGLEIAEKQWQAAANAATGLIKADTNHEHPDAHALYAIARFNLQDREGAVTSAAQALTLDPNREYPLSEYIYGVLLEAKGDIPAAGEHLRRYLELDPKAANAADVRKRIDNLGKNSEPALMALPEPTMTLAGEATVPGGYQALARIARLPKVPTYANFFQEYCRAIVHETSNFNGTPLPEYPGTLQAYMAVIDELTRLGQTRDNRTVVTITSANAGRILPLFGWRTVQQEGSLTVEPGDRPADALRQPIPSALGIDEIALRAALEAGRDFEFSFPNEKARLIGGAAWTALLKNTTIPLPGGIADAFARDFRMAKAYLGLSSMSPEAALAAAAGLGIRSAVTMHADVLAQFGGAFDRLPGGPSAEPAWAELAGVSPKDAPAFYRAVFTRDHGTLAAFYAALAAADNAHQHFFTATPERAQHFYTWYRASGEVHLGVDRQVGTWRPAFFHDLQLDAEGHVHYPGGQAAWTASQAAPDDALATVAHLEALVPVARIEQHRKTALDGGSASLLARRYADWSSLFPYLERMPGLAAADFEALDSFTTKAAALKPSARNTAVGEWHAVVELIVLANGAGSLDAARAAAAFRQACAQLAVSNPSPAAVAIVKSIAGSAGSLDDAVPTNLLRLSQARRAAFDRIKELQNVPSLHSNETLAALAGNVYAALLSPEDLLAAADPALLRKHRFVKDTVDPHQAVFFEPELKSSAVAPGSYFLGGFAQFPPSMPDAPLPKMKPETETAVVSEAAALAAPASGPSEDVPVEAVFRAEARLVEVNTLVTDDRGRYIDDLPASAFTILENGKAVPSVGFENRTAGVSVALLFDTTGSMQRSLPALKSAALKLISELRPIDSVAVYSFADKVTELQPFTTDKAAAQRAVLRTRAAGATALYDSLVRVYQELASRSGKKALVVFTDGADNLSVLTTDIATRRAKNTGLPVYTIAQGDAVRDPALLKQLASLSKSTGGVAFTIAGPGEIRRVFEAVSQDLAHGYLLAFQPPPNESHAWRTIEVRLTESRNRRVRAREGWQ